MTNILNSNILEYITQEFTIGIYQSIKYPKRKETESITRK